MVSEKQYLAGTYALHAAWDSISQDYNRQRQWYETPLDLAMEDIRIIHLAEVTDMPSNSQLDWLESLSGGANWNPPS